ncbi:hypothetical protein SAMN04487783_0900 [Agrococcus baldri]|uniref:Uncharacterized protein n=1 Tax=Agrococcus baldri TaxID=153730 RepID=A0AA94HLC5_9MICO|nr:DUF6226 family protein [Agrococcus baldri]SFS07002.1 hypothetical protein SAMN04487783_0900 [Agrococcus baldri]
MAPPAAFVMPPLPSGRWLDADGRVIAYGNRWGMGSPPDEAYSVTSNTERYAPLHDVADALVAHLLAEYDCAAEAEPTASSGTKELRALRVRPVGGGTGIRFAWTAFPGVLADLGGEVPEAAPMCGCDACDESLERAAAQFCDRVLAHVSGSTAWSRRAD